MSTVSTNSKKLHTTEKEDDYIMNHFTVVGNISREPELRFTPSGEAVVNFNVAQTPRKYDNQEKRWVDASETNFYRCTAWGQKAQNIAESLSKGDRVVVVGRLKTEKYTAKNNDIMTSTNNLDIDEIGPSLSYAEAKPRKNQREGGDNYSSQNRNGGNFGGNGGGGNAGGGWNTGGSGNGADHGGFGGSAPTDEPPF